MRHATFIALLKSEGLPLPEPEYEFHASRAFRFDYAWPHVSVALEVDGGVWTGGRHTRGAGFLRDHEKRNAAACYGWRMIYTTPKQLCTMETVNTIREALLG